MRAAVTQRTESNAFALAAAAVLIGACAERPPAPHSPVSPAALVAAASNVQSQLDAAQSGRRMRGFEDDQLRLEAELPGFGGLAWDASGVLIVWGPPDSSAAAVRTNLGRAIQRVRSSSALRAKIGAGEYQLRPALYAWSQLVDWKDRLAVRALVKVRGAEGVDANELRNRVTVTISDESARAAVMEIATSIGMPRGAIEIELGGVAVEATPRRKNDAAFFSHSLQHTHRPPVGGVEINNELGSNSGCTFGFNARWGESVGNPGIRGFVTASHCALAERGAGVTGTSIRQRLTAENHVGYVELNPAWNQTLSGCTVGGITYEYCTLADVLFVVYDDQTSWSWASMARLAKTNSVGSNYADGSRLLAGYWDVLYDLPFAQGDSLDKLGKSTGWTRGQVTQTCVNRKLVYSANPPNDLTPRDIVFLCSNRVTGSRVMGGDSGSPVFSRVDNTNWVRAQGVLFAQEYDGGFPIPQPCAQTGCHYWFSGWDMIHEHLQTYLCPGTQCCPPEICFPGS